MVINKKNGEDPPFFLFILPFWIGSGHIPLGRIQPVRLSTHRILDKPFGVSDDKIQLDFELTSYILSFLYNTTFLLYVLL